MNPDQLINGWLDSTLSPTDVAKLNHWIKASPANAERFARTAMVHSLLRDRVAGRQLLARADVVLEEHDPLTDAQVLPALDESLLDPEADFPYAPASPAPKAARRQPPLFKLAAAILLALLPAAFLLLRRTDAPAPALAPAPAPAFAHLSATRDAAWEAPSASLKPGDAIPNAPLFLKAGRAQVRFDNGTSFIIDGPARFQVQDVTSTRLTLGKLVAHVPPAGRGFTVRTETATIVDLGTEFGVVVGGDDATRVEVFEGTVTASPAHSTPATAASHKLTAGQAANVTSAAVTIDPAGASPERFARAMTDAVAFLDLADLLCGGDGTTRRRGHSIDVATGRAGKLPPLGNRKGDGTYLPVPSLAVVDGCFIPDASHGPMRIDSAGHQYSVPLADGRSFFQILAGGPIPVPPKGTPVSSRLGGVDYADPQHGLVLLHAFCGITLDLDAIRRLHPNRRLNAFRSLGGVVEDKAGAPKNMLGRADLYVLIDGVVQYERPNVVATDPPLRVNIPLREGDRFLTLILTAGPLGKMENDWFLLGDPRIELQDPPERGSANPRGASGGK